MNNRMPPKDAKYIDYLKALSFGLIVGWRNFPEYTIELKNSFLKFLRDLGMLVLVILCPAFVIISPILAYFVKKSVEKSNALSEKQRKDLLDDMLGV